MLAGLTAGVALFAVANAVRSPPRANATAPAGPASLAVTAAALAVATAAAGAGVAELYGHWDRLPQLLSQPRDLAHSILAGALLALLVTLAAVARFAPRRRRTTVLLAAAVVTALAGQAGTGMLMVLDGSDGGSPVHRLGRPTVQRVVP
jgi:hypothetical protein